MRSLKHVIAFEGDRALQTRCSGLLVGTNPARKAPGPLVCHITDGSVPANAVLECSAPGHPNPASTPTPCATVTRHTKVCFLQRNGEELH